MADLVQTPPSVQSQSGARAAQQPQGPRIYIDFFRVLAYFFLTVGALVSVTPFLWMMSVSLMSLGETQTGRFVTTQGFFERFSYEEGELDKTLEEGIPSFVKETDSIGQRDLAMTGRDYASQRDAYWLVGDNQVLRGGFVNYITAWERANFGRYFFNSVMMTFLTVLFQTTFSILAAYAFARMEFPGRDLLFGLFLTTLFIPSTIQLIPNYLTVVGLNESFNNFYAQNGLTDLARTLGLRWIDGWFGLTVPWLASTFGIFLLRQFFRQVPDELF
ncbi:MAG: carbohydrate ABC transporter permease, partial [Anaerolineae bacterium]|nr:carbohydrate ABC transporter permease [Anaerolineae bacterium]